MQWDHGELICTNNYDENGKLLKTSIRIMT